MLLEPGLPRLMAETARNAAFLAAHTMVRQQQAQAITPPPAGAHIGMQAFAVAGTK